MPDYIKSNPDSMRLNKYISHCGECSRRNAAELVKSGQVKVNGKIQNNPAVLVSDKDTITVGNRKIFRQVGKVYILMNKPKDLVTTLADEKGRKTVMDLIGSKIKERIYPVGRLDRLTTGLLLLTNDGDLTKKLSHPSHKVKKIYQVCLDRRLELKDLEQIRKGVVLDDGYAEVDGISYIENQPKTEIGIELHIGKNRIVRRIFGHLGYQVKKLDRVYYAGLTKKDLPRGRFRHLEKKEIIMLKHFI